MWAINSTSASSSNNRKLLQTSSLKTIGGKKVVGTQRTLQCGGESSWVVLQAAVEQDSHLPGDGKTEKSRKGKCESCPDWQSWISGLQSSTQHSQKLWSTEVRSSGQKAGREEMQGIIDGVFSPQWDTYVNSTTTKAQGILWERRQKEYKGWSVRRRTV